VAGATLCVCAAAAQASPAGHSPARASSATSSGGRVYSFGGNLQGELGRPSPMNDPAPKTVPLPAAAGGAAAIAAGAGHSLIIGSDGRLYAFGSNTLGQLGNGTNLNSTTPNPSPTAVSLPGASGRVARAAGGEDFTLSLTSTGELYSFGGNGLGQLGRGITDSGPDAPHPTPGRVAIPASTRLMAAGEFHALAVTTDDRLFAWGENNFGQLGLPANAGTLIPSPNPTQVPVTHTGTFVSVAAGGEHTLVLTSTGEVFSFGNDQYGQLGRPAGGAGSDSTPGLVTFPGLQGTIVAIAAGQEHSLALSSTGQLYAFGDNRSGRLGTAANDTTDTSNQTPALVKVPSGTDSILQIAAGTNYSLALTSSGRLFGFGDNNYGQLGSPRNNGTDNPNPTPVRVTVPGAASLGAVASSADSQHTLALVAGSAEGSSALHISRVSPAGSTATLKLMCTVRPPQRCAGTITGTSTERLSGGRLVAVTAAASTKTVGRTVTVLRSRYVIAAGQTTRLHVALNAIGRRLLDRFYALPVNLSTNRRHIARTARFRFAIIRAPIDYFWNFRPGYTFIGNLNAGSLKPSWHVILTCHGGGCPVSHVALAIHGGRASGTRALQGARLRPGAVVQLAISAPNAVSEVLRFVMASGRLPRTTALCQTPDQPRPVACHS
jgi:alpha-tubulin suppressor-like RCC1 family protein